jgi:signal transduction histidine kinase
LREERNLINAVAQRIGDSIERRQSEAEIQKRAADLQTVSEISTLASSILDPDKLLQTVVDLTKERFNLYHAHIYLLEEPSQEELLKAEFGDVSYKMRERKLVLRAGYGAAGQQMREQGHNIPLNSERSLVARAARTRQGVIVNNVRGEPDFLPNPLLPETRSEMAIPLILGDRVLGVLDVQSERVNRFTQEDVAIKTTLAGQVASSLENARLFEETKHTEERLREVDRLKSEFLANMSHELRTPLNSIIGYSEVMLMGIDGEMDAETKDDVQAIYDNGKHLLSLINDILDLAKIEAGSVSLSLEDVDMAALLDEVKTNNLGFIHKTKKPIELHVAVDGELPLIRADRLRLNQVFTNLVSNAIKFTEKGSITMRAFQEDGWVRVEVKDTGIGISPEDMKKLFERFRQVDGSNKRRAEGTGLGLSITRYLVQMHGGSIDVHSQVGEGSTFTVSLPISGPEKVEAK